MSTIEKWLSSAQRVADILQGISPQISGVNEHFIYRCGAAADWRAQSVPPRFILLIQHADASHVFEAMAQCRW